MPTSIVTYDPLPSDPYLRLCLFVIRQAIRDLRNAKSARQRRELEVFFESPYYRLYAAYITSSFAELKYADSGLFRPKMERR